MMGKVMSYVHRQLLKRGLLTDLLPDEDLDPSDKEAIEAARADIARKIANEAAVRREIELSVSRLQELNKKNHYGESLRRAFGGV